MFDSIENNERNKVLFLMTLTLCAFILWIVVASTISTLVNIWAMTHGSVIILLVANGLIVLFWAFVSFVSKYYLVKKIKK